MKRIALVAGLLLAVPALGAYDMNGVLLGAREADVKRQFPSIHCKALEWQSRAAERRCDDSRAALGGVEVQVTFYLKKDAVEAFDVRLDTKDLERFVGFLKSRYGEPVAETRDTIERKGKKPRKTYSARWEKDGARAVLAAQLEKRRASLLVSRGDFDEEIYRVR